MPTVRVTPEGLPRALARRFRGIAKVVNRGIERGAQRGKTLLVRRTPKDTGFMKAAWMVSKVPPYSIYNEASYAGVIELGARPHSMGREGIANLALWAKRVLGVSEKEATSVAFAIAHKLRTKGQKPTYFVRNSMEELRGLLAQAMVTEVSRYANAKEPA